MKIKPDDNWCWYFDHEHERLMLDLSNGMLFRSRFLPKMLISDAFDRFPFCVEDASLYYSYMEHIQNLPLTADYQAELALNALVANRFLKPQMPKSWHFQTQSPFCHPSHGQIVRVCLVESGESALFMVVEAGENASLCLLAQSSLCLAGRDMILGDAIKIMHDRLQPASLYNRTQPADFAAAV